MRFISALLLAVLLPSLCDAQIFRRRERTVCPGPTCPSIIYPPIPGEKTVETVPTEVEEIIPTEIRVRNPNLQCVWVAAEEVLVAAGYQEFKGWGEEGAKHGFRGSDLSAVTQALDKQGIEYLATRNRDVSLFQHARREGVGVYVQVPGHALVCVAMDDKYAYMLNNYTDPERSKKIEKWSLSRFMERWTGVAMCVKRKKKPPDPAKPETSKPAVCPCPVKPATPAICPCPGKPAEPAVDLKPVMNKIDDLGQAVTKLTDTAVKITDSLGATNTRLSGVENRLSAVENSKCNCPATAPVVTPPPASNSELDKIREDLDKLRKAMKFSGTLTFTVDRK